MNVNGLQIPLESVLDRIEKKIDRIDEQMNNKANQDLVAALASRVETNSNKLAILDSQIVKRNGPIVDRISLLERSNYDMLQELKELKAISLEYIPIVDQLNEDSKKIKYMTTEHSQAWNHKHKILLFAVAVWAVCIPTLNLLLNLG